MIPVGGPLGDGERRFLLVFDAPSEAAIRQRLAEDPWTPMELLRIASVEPWEILLGELASDEGVAVSIREMLEAHPQPIVGELDVRARCIDACLECAATCTSCADADIAEDDAQEMIRCTRLCLDCADVCDATRRIVTRQTDADGAAVRIVVEACLAACRASREECERHAAHHEHCRICAEVCRRCEQACADLLGALA